ncbi:hypothetical protein QYE76_011941 [Lolium multiflorum]|uniref:Transposon protein, putative, CACTA, En/Spm sub-class n=1 Tax=Lolium multiflorum TaxID=4521 RepID=A0AAD8U045_LOLMU|nr:hypothetical protein QYE76_011941 [Lolium multiflorum]
MADNGWMYNERVSATEKTDEWTRKTHFLVNELARGTKGLARALCPCVRCVKRQRRGKDEMYRHLLQYGYMHGYVTEIDFDERERDRGEVMRQRLNGNEYDGIRDFLDDLVHADVPDSPPPEPEAPPEPEEPEPTAKAFYDMIAAAKRPLYEGAAISQLDAISQCLADKTRYNTTREGFEASLKTTGNMLPKDHCLPQSLHATRRMMKDLNMDYQRIDCCPKGCVLFWRQYAEDKYCPICKQSRPSLPETHQKGRANPKTINTGVFTKGANNFDYYGRLQSVYELTFNRTNVQLNIVVFKCHWFDPIGGQRSDKSIGLVEVKPSTTYSGADVFVVAHQAKQVYYLPYPCQKAELKGWEVVFQVSPHGNLPIPSEDDYNNIDPVTYEGIFYQEEQDFGEYILEPFVQEDLGNDAETRGESVVDLKDISMLEKLLEANDNYDEPPPVDPSTLYSQDSDSDSDPEKEKEKETEYESERESDDGW